MNIVRKRLTVKFVYETILTENKSEHEFCGIGDSDRQQYLGQTTLSNSSTLSLLLVRSTKLNI